MRVPEGFSVFQKGLSSRAETDQEAEDVGSESEEACEEDCLSRAELEGGNVHGANLSRVHRFSVVDGGY